MYLNMQSFHTTTEKKRMRFTCIYLRACIYLSHLSRLPEFFIFPTLLISQTQPQKIFCHLSLYYLIYKPSALVSCHQHRTILKPTSQCQAASYTFHFDLRKLASEADSSSYWPLCWGPQLGTQS